MKTDSNCRSPLMAAVNIGEIAIYQGRRYILCGVDAVSVEPRQAYLRDALTGEEITVHLEELTPPLWDDRNGH